MNSSQTKQDPQQNDTLSNWSVSEIEIRQLLEIKDDLDLVLQKLLLKIKYAQLHGMEDENSCQKHWLSSYEEEEIISQNFDKFIAKYDDELSKLPIAILYRILNGYFSQAVNKRTAIHEDILSKFFFHCLDSHKGDQKRSILVSVIHFEEKKFEVYKTIVEKYEDVAHSNYISHLITEVLTQISKNEEKMSLYNAQRVYITIFFVFIIVFIYQFFHQSFKQKTIDCQLMNQQRITEISVGYENKLRDMNRQLDNQLQDNIKSHQKRNDELAAEIKDVDIQIKQVSISHQNEMNSLNERMKEKIKTLRNQLKIIKNENLNNISLMKSILKDTNESVFSKMMNIYNQEKYDIELVNNRISHFQNESLTNITLMKSILNDLNESIFTKIATLVDIHLINEKLRKASADNQNEIRSLNEQFQALLMDTNESIFKRIASIEEKKIFKTNLYDEKLRKCQSDVTKLSHDFSNIQQSLIKANSTIHKLETAINFISVFLIVFILYAFYVVILKH